MAFTTAGQFGPDALLDAFGNALVGATVTVPAGYTGSVDTFGNLTVVGPPAQSVAVTVDPVSGPAVTINVTVPPAVEELVSADDLAADVTRQSQTYAPPASSETVGIIGDSIAAGTTGGRWLRETAVRSGGRLVEQTNAGVGGNTSTQMLARIDADLLNKPLPPKWVIIEGVTPNDPAAAISLDTAKANITAMVAKVQAKGLRPVLVLGPPNDTAATRDFMLRMNAWLVRFADARGIPTVDLYTPVADPADGTFAAAMTSDGVHLSTAGAQAIAQAIVDAGLPANMQATGNRWATGKNDPANLIVNGVLNGDSNADGVADSWYLISGFATRSLVARTGGLGNWQELTSAGATESMACNNIPASAGWAVGDLIEMTAEVQVTAGATTTLLLRPVYNTSTAIPTTEPGANADWSTLGPTPSGATVRVLRRFTVPADATQLALRVIMSGGAGTARIGRAAYRNLTALGLV